MTLKSIAFALLVPFLVEAVLASSATAVTLPEDATQSIVYWKPHIVAATDDPQVQQAQSIFQVLLRTWDGTRIAPALHVVNSSTGPWAASLADGNILLSVQALRTCLAFGEQRAEHLLAFVLSHELAHQRADDLWHQKFFRLIGNQSAERKQALLRGIDTQWLNDVEEKEAQADHDGVIMMASVGYDPYQILDQRDFFTAWVEQLWHGSCADVSASDSAYGACQQANSRRLRTQTQLYTLTRQTTVYDLAMQAFVAGRYAEARQLFNVYGRELPSRAVYTSLGLSYLAQALEIKHDPQYLRASGEAALYYPILLDSQPQPNTTTGLDVTKRGVSPDSALQQQRQQIQTLAEQAVASFEKAIKLNPSHKRAYLLLSLSYLVSGNTYMARGVMLGQFQPRFGPSPSLSLLLAMTTAVEGKPAAAIEQLRRLTQSPRDTQREDALPDTLLTYATFHNLVILMQHQSNQNTAITEPWRELATLAKREGNGLLFQMALANLKPELAAALSLDRHPQILQFRPGDLLQSDLLQQTPELEHSEIWIEGEKQELYRLPSQGIRFVVDRDNRITHAWQQGVRSKSLGRLHIGDDVERSLKVFGLPDRELFFTSGTYLAYDRYGIGLHILNDKVAGWFLYGQQIR